MSSLADCTDCSVMVMASSKSQREPFALLGPFHAGHEHARTVPCAAGPSRRMRTRPGRPPPLPDLRDATGRCIIGLVVTTADARRTIHHTG
ncbi:hypothetical protein GCM10010421_48180 [Streptomyces glaucus]|uniref:Secreted protein n=1 Tax=Streptomyces glaucus TaxID=284029 RepID=A0ABN3K5L8_9ACTN